MKKQDDKTREALMELLATGLIVVMYWVSMQPEWKLEMYFRQIANRFRLNLSRDRDELPLRHRVEIEKFRKEISAWEHDQK
jgi:hypothetical protein